MRFKYLISWTSTYKSLPNLVTLDLFWTISFSRSNIFSRFKWNNCTLQLRKYIVNFFANVGFVISPVPDIVDVDFRLGILLRFSTNKWCCVVFCCGENSRFKDQNEHDTVQMTKMFHCRSSIIIGNFWKWIINLNEHVYFMIGSAE